MLEKFHFIDLFKRIAHIYQQWKEYTRVSTVANFHSGDVLIALEMLAIFEESY